MNAVSQNIAQILGTNTSAFELLVLKRRIMGPCWITIKNPVIDNKGVSSRPIFTTFPSNLDTLRFPGASWRLLYPTRKISIHFRKPMFLLLKICHLST